MKNMYIIFGATLCALWLYAMSMWAVEVERPAQSRRESARNKERTLTQRRRDALQDRTPNSNRGNARWVTGQEVDGQEEQDSANTQQH